MEVKEYEQLLNEVENKLDRLKALYEQWFQGIERLEPQVPRKDLERRLQMLFKEKPRNTALRFRYQMLMQRWTTYLTYWGRVTRQIEEGTYRRDVLKARKRREEMRRGRGATWEADFDVDVSEDSIEAGDFVDESEKTPPRGTPLPPSLRPGTPVRPPLAPIAPIAPIAPAAAASPGASTAPPRRPLSTFGLPLGAKSVAPKASTAPAPAPAPPVTAPPAVGAPPPPRPMATFARPKPAEERGDGALGENELRRIYNTYVDARRRNNESPDVKYESLAKSIRDMEPKLRQKYAGKKIDFEVVVQNGKVGLKPVPK